MAKIHSLMDIGKRSMMNSQTALQTVAHNIANKTTEGYSRQRVDQVTNQPIMEGNLLIGTGARAAKVTRTNNPFLEKQLQKETTHFSFLNSQAESLQKVEAIFNEQENKGLNQYLTDFFNAFRELSNNPESTTTRTMVKEAAESLSKDFHRVDSQLVAVQEGIDEQIQAHASEINRITKEIADLNKKIAEIEIQGVPANDPRDRRDLLVKKLNEHLDIHVAEGDKGTLTITTSGNAILVSTFDAMELRTYRDPGTNRMQLHYVQSESHPPINITSRIRGGAIGGALIVRDQVVEDLKNKVDDLAHSTAAEVNRVHSEGYDRMGRKAGNFFNVLGDKAGSAQNIKLSEAIADDVTRIASASKPNAPGDNTVANVMSMLQYKGVMDEGSTTLDDFYKAQVGQVGVVVSRANKSKEAQSNIVQQVSNLRESVSGVSLDEETTKMIEFQKAFDASARVIRVADEMFDTVLNLKRL